VRGNRNGPKSSEVTPGRFSSLGETQLPQRVVGCYCAPARGEKLCGFILRSAQSKTLKGVQIEVSFREEHWILAGIICLLKCRRSFQGPLTCERKAT
jgi:hypothetical protein